MSFYGMTFIANRKTWAKITLALVDFFMTSSLMNEIIRCKKFYLLPFGMVEAVAMAAEKEAKTKDANILIDWCCV